MGSPDSGECLVHSDAHHDMGLPGMEDVTLHNSPLQRLRDVVLSSDLLAIGCRIPHNLNDLHN